ncbi:hypothetical protein [Paenibacillus xerothermodurans]|uniref:Uncharacterized protein n=1 Tax=Paenibacillus xerothermodurans TaxID=1977292 RepID=A0A2W1NT32_PAEXE|nr:hypothetical protein [Paenibacillus xerothermodurans]PZE20936.1 hypothetical protein CBW46_009600 [Paenibacillus xerothermodurans]
MKGYDMEGGFWRHPASYSGAQPYSGARPYSGAQSDNGAQPYSGAHPAEQAIPAAPSANNEPLGEQAQLQQLIDRLGGVDAIVKALSSPEMKRVIKQLQPLLFTAMSSILSGSASAPIGHRAAKKHKRRPRARKTV